MNKRIRNLVCSGIVSIQIDSNVIFWYSVDRSTVEQKNSTSLPADNAKAQDTGQQNNQGKGSFNGSGLL